MCVCVISVRVLLDELKITSSVHSVHVAELRLVFKFTGSKVPLGSISSKVLEGEIHRL